MARISSKNIATGRVAHLVYRNLNGQQIVQVHPGKLKQTQATKASGSEFRQCSSWAKQLRVGLHSFLVDLTDSYMYRRLTGQLYHAILANTDKPRGERTPLTSDMKSLEDFEFNTHSPFSRYFKSEIAVAMDAERKITVTIPALDSGTDLHFPQEADKAELIVLVYATDFGDSQNPFENFFTLNLQQNTALSEATAWTSAPVPEGFFVMATAKLLFYSTNPFSGRNYCNSKTLNPAMVLFCGTV